MHFFVFRIFCYYCQLTKNWCMAYSPDWKCEKENLDDILALAPSEAGEVLNEQWRVWAHQEAVGDFPQTALCTAGLCNQWLWAVSNTKQFPCSSNGLILLLISSSRSWKHLFFCFLSFKGAKKEGAAGFFKGIGKGLVGVVARPTGGIVDMASSTFQGIQRYSAKRRFWSIPPVLDTRW